MNRTHIFNDSVFWHHFQTRVRSKLWRCDFSTGYLLNNLVQDEKKYKERSILRLRRNRIVPWMNNTDQWATVILGACVELANDQRGPHSRTLENLDVIEALGDFVEHLNCFYTIASTMSGQGHAFHSQSQYSSEVHDIDKLDPMMLVGYSERFQDDATTSVWDLCVARHVYVNPHHQANYLWHNTFEDGSTSSNRSEALREMVCDKVSRRLQKNLDGVIGSDMWNVDIVYFDGLPRDWLEKATGIMDLMKRNGVSGDMGSSIHEASGFGSG